MNAISSVPAYACPLRDEDLVLKEVCDKCTHKNDEEEYYLPREGGVIYCDFNFVKHSEEYNKMRMGRQDDKIKELHRDEAKRNEQILESLARARAENSRVDKKAGLS